MALGHWRETAIRLGAVAFLAGICGCTGWGLRDEGFRKQGDLPETARQARSENAGPSKPHDGGYWGLSEKSRQIERDLAH